MARNKLPKSDFAETNRPWFSTGIVVLIIVALGFLAFDTISRDENGSKEGQDQEEEQGKGGEEGKEEGNGSDEEKGETAGTSLPSTYVVAQGDSLWKLAQRYYNDGYKWTVIAKENNLTNPDVLHTGTSLSIPKVEVAAAVTTTLPTQYTVVKGDTLWELARKYYNDPYQWFRIRDANAGKVGLLSNGRPLIEIGSVLTIPKL